MDFPEDWEEIDYEIDEEEVEELYSKLMDDLEDLNDEPWTSEGLYGEDIDEDLPTLYEFSLESDQEIVRALDENFEEQEFHREEIETAYKQGNDFAVTVLLSTFFESYLSTKLSAFAETNETILEPEEIQDGALSYHEMISKADKLDILDNDEKEKKIMKAVGSSRNQYLYESFEHLDPENETIIQESNLIDKALDLYDSRLGIEPENRIIENEREENSSAEDAIERIEDTIKNGSKVVSTTLMNSIFQQYMVDHLNKPGNGRMTITGSKIKGRDEPFYAIKNRFKNFRYAETNKDDLGMDKSEFDRMIQVFEGIYDAKKEYSHNIASFAEGNGIEDDIFEDAIEYFDKIKKEVFPDSGTYAPSSDKQDKWGREL